MLINFYIKSAGNESVTVRFQEGHDDKEMEIPLTNNAGEYTEGTINSEDHPLLQKFSYSIIVKKQGLIPGEHTLVSGKINLKKYKASVINICYENPATNSFTKLSQTKPFKEVFKQKKTKSAKQASAKRTTHIFKTEYPVLQNKKSVCLTGSGEKMHAFDVKKPLLFKKKKNHKSSIKLDLSKEFFPLEYKIAIYDADAKAIIDYEPGDNHILSHVNEKGTVNIIHLDHYFEKYAWKGAGINIPLFSLRSEKSWGSGDFSDLITLVDYAEITGFKLIQLLPLNDTASSFTDKDSYPYSAISAFALHLKYLDVQQMAHRLSVEITAEEQEKINTLNGLSYCDHNGVMELKTAVLKKLFEEDKYDFRDDQDWFSFFDMNREWLVPYAAFCTLRDKYKTADFAQWEDYAGFSEDNIQQLVSPKSEEYNGILFWYYVQFHLYLQLKNASDYARKNGVILKADLPIGVGRLSADTWQNPELFNMNMQAGAPPDAFSGKGQNWGFPTYNLQQMAFDHYAWFRKRLEHLEEYFDAVRIDHVLGFFRIWSIPINQVDGRMGRFVPAIPVAEHDFTNAGLTLDAERYCTPFITEALLQQKFGSSSEEVKKLFFENGNLSERFDDQKKIAEYFKANPANKIWEEGLNDIVANIILFRDDSNAGGYHFRINLKETTSYAHLPDDEKTKLDDLYDKYFFSMQNELWQTEGIEKLQMLKNCTSMLICAEDLGMVPNFVPGVLHSLNILSLQVQQMPKKNDEQFSDVNIANYESVVMPATHDMAPVRLWWEQNKAGARVFFNTVLKEEGTAPYFCEPWVCKKIMTLHLQSPAMWSIFLLQDILSINGNVRRPNPTEERINDPADPDHVWNYRMHINLEDLLLQKELINEIKTMIKESRR